MFPLRVETEYRVFPILCLSLVVSNVLFFLLSQSQYPDGRFVLVYGVSVDQMGFWKFWTSMFSHAGWAHLLGNMWFLWLFGRAVEDDLGPFGFLGLYTLSGIGATVLHLVIGGRAGVPLVGASGAIAGLMISYLVLFPKAQALCTMDRITYMIVRAFKWGGSGYESRSVWSTLFCIDTVPAFVVLGLFVIMDVFGGLASSGQGGGTAHWGHVGGYLTGAALGFILKPRLRTGMVMSHIKLPPAEVRNKAAAPAALQTQPRQEEKPVWVNWEAVLRQLEQDNWPPKLSEFARVGDRDAFLALLNRIRQAQQMSGNQDRLRRIDGIRQLLGVRD